MILFFLKKTSVSLGVSILSCVLIISFGFYAVGHHNQVKELEHRLLFLNRQAVRSQEAMALLKVHESEFSAFQACKFEQPLSPEMLQNSTPHTIEFAKNSILNTDPLVSQSLSFSVSCLRDRDIFILLERLFNEGPGLFQIHEVTIHRISALSEEMLEKIADGKPQALFDGKVAATWIHR